MVGPGVRRATAVVRATVVALVVALAVPAVALAAQGPGGAGRQPTGPGGGGGGAGGGGLAQTGFDAWQVALLGAALVAAALFLFRSARTAHD